MTNLDIACRAFGWQGGTIHQVASWLGRSGQGSLLASMPTDEFCALLNYDLTQFAEMVRTGTPKD